MLKVVLLTVVALWADGSVSTFSKPVPSIEMCEQAWADFMELSAPELEKGHQFIHRCVEKGE